MTRFPAFISITAKCTSHFLLLDPHRHLQISADTLVAVSWRWVHRDWKMFKLGRIMKKSEPVRATYTAAFLITSEWNARNEWCLFLRTQKSGASESAICCNTVVLLIVEKILQQTLAKVPSFRPSLIKPDPVSRNLVRLYDPTGKCFEEKQQLLSKKWFTHFGAYPVAK